MTLHAVNFNVMQLHLIQLSLLYSWIIILYECYNTYKLRLTTTVGIGLGLMLLHTCILHCYYILQEKRGQALRISLQLFPLLSRITQLIKLQMMYIHQGLFPLSSTNSAETARQIWLYHHMHGCHI